MKTFSQVVKLFDNSEIPKNKVYEIEACDLVRIYKAHQKALNEKVALEAKVAMYELELRKERVIYG